MKQWLALSVFFNIAGVVGEIQEPRQLRVESSGLRIEEQFHTDASSGDGYWSSEGLDGGGNFFDEELAADPRQACLRSEFIK